MLLPRNFKTNGLYLISFLILGLIITKLKFPKLCAIKKVTSFYFNNAKSIKLKAYHKKYAVDKFYRETFQPKFKASYDLIVTDDLETYNNANFDLEVRDSYYDHFFNKTLKTQKFICCYRDPQNPKSRLGRPFPITPHVLEHYFPYMYKSSISKEEKVEKSPVPITAASSNHFREHLTHLPKIKEAFPGQKIVFYDLGLSPGEVVYLKKSPDHIYKKFDFTKYPDHVGYLKNYAWKIMIWAEALPEFGAIAWFDSSIWFWESLEDSVENLMKPTNTCWLYYIKEASHDITSHTHPNMYGYFPSDMKKHSDRELTKMKMAGAVVIFNDDDCKHNIIKWGILCALTEECIQPSTSRKQCPPMNTYIYNQSYFQKERDMVPYIPKPEYGIQMKPFLICHRFDQSLFSILVHNFYDFNENRIYIDVKKQIAKPYRTGEYITIEGLENNRKETKIERKSNISAADTIKIIEDIEAKMGIKHLNDKQLQYERQKKLAINKIVARTEAKANMNIYNYNAQTNQMERLKNKLGF